MIDRDYWFAKTEKKFLHNIDTFYYSVKLCNDLTRESTDPDVLRLRRVIDKYHALDVDSTLFREVAYPVEVMYRYGTYHSYYNFILDIPEKYDFCIAPVVPPAASGIGSVTSEIVVKIHARVLWELGATLAFEESYQYVQAFCEHFHLTIQEVKENRVDYAWHTNALQNPETYFRIDHFAEMQVSRFDGINYHYKFKNRRTCPEFMDEDETSYEWDYCSMGRRGAKCFVRIYLKTKEVVEMGYKGWFLYTWLFQGLISRYDLYVLERAYQRRRWNYCDIARLEFALEYDDTLSEAARSLIRAHITSETPDYASIARLADKYTPKLTKILNVEFQTMRKMSKSFQLLQTRDNSAYGPAKRIYDYLDNRRLITESPTHSTLRLVRPDRTDGNKWRADYTDFWRRLRGTRQVDVVCNKHDLKLIREYTSQLNMEVRKTKAARAVSSFALALNHNPETTIYEDAAELLAVLNDNDFQRLFHYKHVRMKRETDNPLHDYVRQRRVAIVDETGEIYENTGYD